MKHKLLIHLASLTLALLLCGTARVNSFAVQTPDGEGGPILLDPIPNNPGGPRSQGDIPLFAELLDGYVLLGCSGLSVGVVRVSLISTAGDWTETVYESSEGPILIPISGNPGQYRLTLVLENGAGYVGTFVI